MNLPFLEIATLIKKFAVCILGIDRLAQVSLSRGGEKKVIEVS